MSKSPEETFRIGNCSASVFVNEIDGDGTFQLATLFGAGDFVWSGRFCLERAILFGAGDFVTSLMVHSVAVAEPER